MNPEEKPLEKIAEKPKEPVENTAEKPAPFKIKSLRTYQGDVDEILSKGKASASTILIAEQKRREEKVITTEKPRDPGIRNRFFIILGISLFMLGVVTLVAVYYRKSTEEVAIIQKTKALISFSEEKNIELLGLSRDAMLTKLIEEKTSFNLPVNSVLYINTTGGDEKPVAIENVLRLISPKIPDSLSRSFENKYMLGIYAYDTNEIFIILTTEDYGASYSGMLKWEKDIVSDLGRLFGISQNASSTAPVFVDEALKNKDLRVLKDESGETKLLYSFIDRNTLIITANENILTAILAKYLINQTVR